MMRTTVFPMRNFHVKPAFWGLDRDFKDVMDSIQDVWEGVDQSTHTDFKETEQAYFMALDLPGVNKKNIEVQVEGDYILINATRKKAFFEGDESNKKISRKVLLPKEVDKENVQAHCEDGVLYLALPKVEKAKPKKIEITEGFEGSTWNKILSENSANKATSAS